MYDDQCRICAVTGHEPNTFIYIEIKMTVAWTSESDFVNIMLPWRACDAMDVVLHSFDDWTHNVVACWLGVAGRGLLRSAAATE